MKDVILRYVRQRCGATVPLIDKWDDKELLRRMFINDQSLRLTKFGQTLMQSCFQSFAFPMTQLQAVQLVYLSNRCKMPFYYGGNQDGQLQLCLYEAELAVLLRLADGDISVCIDVDAKE